MRHLLPLLLLASCTGRPLPNGDGGIDTDADVRGLGCGDLHDAIGAWLDGHTACAVDADCTEVATGCGLPEPCGAYVNTAARGPYLDSLMANWRDKQCATPCGLDCPFFGAAVCVAGRCQAGGPPPAPKPIGAACAADGECQTGECASEAETGGLLPGGLCTIRDCNFNTKQACPAGTRCENPGNGHFYCLVDCCPNCNNAPQCRAGWACCGNPQTGNQDAACAPATSPLCGQEG